MLNKSLNTIIRWSFVFILALNSCKEGQNKKKENLSIKDSVSYYIKKPKQLREAKKWNNLIVDETIRKNNFLKIAYQAHKHSDSTVFKFANKAALKLSVKLNDTSGIAETHWNLGSHYANLQILDSSYYHYYQAHKYYNLVENDNYSAKMLYNMAFVQSRLKDYTSAEAKLFQAISIYNRLGKDLSLYRCYNALANNYSEIRDFENSIVYHQKSVDVLDNVKNKKTYYERTLNDIGLAYQIQGDYSTSIDFFQKALNNSQLKDDDVNLYARLKDNLAYSKTLIGDTLNTERLFMEGMTIRDSLNNMAGVAINKLHLSEFYLYTKDTIKAFKEVKDAYYLARKSSNKNEVLSSLMLLSKIDKKDAGKYLEEHVRLSDSLFDYERKLKNKFARIRFETDEYIAKSEKLALQKSLILTFGFAIVSILSLLYFITVQRSKNKQLKQEQLQQKANEEIYKLMLRQQSKLEEGRLKERHRISEELHDGVLGKIFSVRMGLGFLDIEGNKDTLEKQENYINSLQVIEKEIRDISHELKNEILSSNSDYIVLIENLVTEKSDIGKFDYEIENKDAFFWNDSNESIKINVYRIVQEALQNIIKHSKAKKVFLSFSYNNNTLVLVIKDDGIGFNFNKKTNGIGLENMRSRIYNLHGMFEVKSQPKIGTIIDIKIPFK